MFVLLRVCGTRAVAVAAAAAAATAVPPAHFPFVDPRVPAASFDS